MARAIGKTKADISFCTKLEKLIKRPFIMAMFAGDGPTPPAKREPLDMSATQELFTQYGTYLELIGLDTPVGEVRLFTFPNTSKTSTS